MLEHDAAGGEHADHRSVSAARNLSGEAAGPANERRPIHPLVAAWLLVALWIGRMRQRRALAELDDKMLQDIGITRYDAARECGKPFWR